MKTYCLCFLVLVQIGYVFSQEKVGISGVITDEFNNPVPDALIKINWSNLGLLSKNDGSFYITVDPTDTLVIKHLSFETKAIAVNNLKNLDSLKIQLTPKSFELDEVEINNWGTWQDFKHKIKSMDADSIRKTEGYQLATMFSPSNIDYSEPIPFDILEVPAMSPTFARQFNPFSVSFVSIFNTSSSKHTTPILSKLQKEEQQELSVEKNAHRYTKKYVGRILNIEGEELHSFKMYCDYFINLDQNDYKMIQQIKSLYTKWKKIEDPDVPDSIPPLPELSN